MECCRSRTGREQKKLSRFCVDQLDAKVLGLTFSWREDDKHNGRALDPPSRLASMVDPL